MGTLTPRATSQCPWVGPGLRFEPLALALFGELRRPSAHVAVLGAYYGIFNHAVSPLYSARRAAARKRIFYPEISNAHRTRTCYLPVCER